MVSNAWSLRRSTIKRPPVCKSRPDVGDGTPFPLTIRLAWSWTGFIPGKGGSTEAQLLAIFPKIPGTNVYPISGVTNQGANYAGQVAINLTPTLSTFSVTILDGPLVGVIISGTGTTWNQTHPFNGNGTNGSAPPGIVGIWSYQYD